MENRRILRLTFFVLALLWSAFSFSQTFAYSAHTTHPALTDEVVDFYNHFYPQTAFSDEEKGFIVSGSSEEDAPITRVVNHFYDPIRNIGLLGNPTAKIWLASTRRQAASLGNITVGVSTPLYSASGDYSWERAIYEYVHGDKKRALVGLGHTLHLIEDMAVPEHTRNDQHLVGVDTSPYEEWTSQFTPQNIATAQDLIAQGKTPILYNSIDTYMDQLALFTNNHFFSKDTLPFPEAGSSSIHEGRYPVPKYTIVGVGLLSGGEFQSYGISEIKGTQYKLFELQEKRSKKIKSGTEKIYKIYSDSGDQLIFKDYWNILSKEAVVNGAGVVKLFFDEVEKEKQTLALYNKNKSWLSRVLPERFVPSYTRGDLTPRQNLASVSTAITQPQTVLENPGSVVEPVIVSKSELSKEADIEESIPVEDSIEEPVVEYHENYSPDAPGIRTPFVGFGGDGGASLLDDEEDTVVETSATPSVSSPSANAILATSTVSFQGSAAVGAVISQTVSSTTATTDVDGNWSMSLYGFSDGTHSISFTAKENNKETSTATTTSFSTDTTAPTLSSFSVLECSYSLTTSGCVSGDFSFRLSWSSSSSDIAYYGVWKDSSEVATTTNTSSTVTLNTTSGSLFVVARDTAGNTATSSTQSVAVATSTVVINEIAWAGTQASAFDEWIELYNRSSYTIDLSRIVISADDGTPYITISGSLSPSSYYLIERTDASVTSVTEDLVAAFSGTGGGSGLDNSGEVLSLFHLVGGVATTTIDATPALSVCSGWCGGEATTSPRSMERKYAERFGTDASNWASNNTSTKNGTDADGNVILGTPKSVNSATPPPPPPPGTGSM